MAQGWKALQADRESCSISITPIVKLAQCVNTEDVVAHLARIAADKGVALYDVKLVRTGLSREWKVQDIPTVSTEVQDLEAHVEGGQTHLVQRLGGRMDAAVRCELEDAAYMAAQRIELCERRLCRREERQEPSTLEIEGMIGNSGPMQALTRCIKTAASCDSTTLIVGESGTGKELAARAIHQL